MKYLIKFNESLSKETKEYIDDIELYLKDIGLKIEYDFPDYLFLGTMFITPIKAFYKMSRSYFTLEQIRDEINHIISYMEEFGHELHSVKYLANRWVTMYDSSVKNRLGIKQQKYDIFDIQDKDLTEDKVVIFELRFKN